MSKPVSQTASSGTRAPPYIVSAIEPRKHLWQLLLPMLPVCFVAAAASAPTQDNGIILDDDYMLAHSAEIPDLHNIVSFFSSTPPQSINRAYYRPITLTSFALRFEHDGFSPHPCFSVTLSWLVWSSPVASVGRERGCGPVGRAALAVHLCRMRWYI
jgi:hypothetical protein